MNTGRQSARPAAGRDATGQRADVATPDREAAHSATFELRPRGPFSLAAARDFAGGFPAGIGGGGPTGSSLVMAFPVEPASHERVGGWSHSAVVELRQEAPDATVSARVLTPGDPEAALAQAARAVSLDADGTGWAEVGVRDPVVGALQREHAYLRPVSFYSAYEAATSFVIGQRIARVQSARIKARLAELAGDALELDGVTFRAFPRPERLLEVESVPGMAGPKMPRLHELARAALDGRLRTARLRSITPEVALAELRTLPGVGDFTAQGILLRGCGLVDVLPGDELSRDVVETMYADEIAAGGTPSAITDRWRPYRMWATVLLRVGWGRLRGGKVSYRRGSPRLRERGAG